MPEGSDTLIIPTILTSGSLHFAEVSVDGQVQDVVDALLQVDGVKEDIIGDLEESGWALQRVRLEPSGRPWEEDELMALGDGKCNFSGHCTITPVHLMLTQELYNQVHWSHQLSPVIAVIPNLSSDISLRFQ